jgi:4-amino-4-deoxy-L-arabinose transferase-like glycosyltransferase
MPHAAKLALVILAAAAVYLVGIGRVQLFDRDEPRNAQAARQMLQSGDWVVPRLLDKVRTAKPPFTYWCQASVMSFIGDGSGGWGDTAAARLPSVVAMMLTLIVLGVVLTRYVDRERAFWTVLILATSGIVIGFLAKGSMHDALLLLWVTIAQMCLYAILRGHGTWPVVITMAVAIALAGLTKGPVVLGVMATTLIALAILSWLGRRAQASLPEEARARRPSYVAVKVIVALAIVAAIVAPWAWLVEHRSPGFLFTSVSNEVLRRIAEPLEQHKGPPGYYLLTVWGTYFPWSVLLPLAMVVAWRHRDEPMIRFALAAVIGPWLMFEIVKTKLPHYLLPTFPPLAFLTADAIVRCLRGEHDDLITKGTRGAIVAWGVIVIGMGVAPWLTPAKLDRPPIVVMLAFSFVAALYAAAVIVPFLRRRPRAGLIAMGVGMMPAMMIIWGFYLPSAHFLRLSGCVGDLLKQNGGGPRDTRVGDVQMIGYKEPSLAFHQGGTIREQSDDAFLAHTPLEQWPRFMTIRDDLWQTTPSAAKEQLEVIGSCRGIAYAAGGKTWTVWVVRTKR